MFLLRRQNMYIQQSTSRFFKLNLYWAKLYKYLLCFVLIFTKENNIIDMHDMFYTVHIANMMQIKKKKKHFSKLLVTSMFCSN